MRSGKSRQKRKERAPLEEPVEEEVQLAGEEDEPELTVKEWLELHQLRSLFTVVKVCAAPVLMPRHAIRS